MSAVKATASVVSPASPDEAQQMIDDHLRSDVGGCCVSCGQPAPCHGRAVGHAAMFAMGLLPKRRLGIDRMPVASKFAAFASR